MKLHQLLRFACGLSLLTLPAASWSQSLPPSLRACAAIADADRRHACYDREVDRILVLERARSVPTPAPSVASSPAPPIEAGAVAAEPSPAPAARALSSTEERTAPRRSGHQRSGDREDDRISARIVSIDSDPNELILHLDNGQVWQQSDRTPGGLSLRAGDTVTIEKRFGSYWLSARHVSGMKMRKKSG